MNTRQKAKHYKRLFEETKLLPNPKVTVTLPKHYKAQHMEYRGYADSFYTQGFGKILEESEIDILLSQIRPFIKQNAKVERDKYTGNYIYTVDIWLER